MHLGTMEDYDKVRTMALKFLDTTEYKELSDVDVIEGIIKDIFSLPKEDGGILIHEDGMLAYRRVPFTFGRRFIGTEVAAWVEPEARGNGVGKDLIDGYEYWAQNLGDCFAVTLSSLDDQIGKFYEKNGYKLYERAYMKVF